MTSGEKMRRRRMVELCGARAVTAHARRKTLPVMAEPIAQPAVAVTSIHNALLQQLAAARAARTGTSVEAARRTIELEALRIGIAAVQTAEDVLDGQRRFVMNGTEVEGQSCYVDTSTGEIRES